MNENSYSNPILLVEDNPVDVDLTLRAFEYRNLANPIHVARDGEEALAWIDRWLQGEPVPVVILLDLKLPRVDGLEVLKKIKSNSKLKSIPVVILTTSTEDLDIKTAYELGANSYIVKPVDFDKFLDIAKQIELYWNVINKPYLAGNQSG
jgi:CheY-like chemotaxis protein